MNGAGDPLEPLRDTIMFFMKLGAERQAEQRQEAMLNRMASFRDQLARKRQLEMPRRAATPRYFERPEAVYSYTPGAPEAVKVPGLPGKPAPSKEAKPRVPTLRQQEQINAIKESLKRGELVTATMLGQPFIKRNVTRDEARQFINSKGWSEGWFADELKNLPETKGPSVAKPGRNKLQELKELLGVQ